MRERVRQAGRPIPHPEPRPQGDLLPPGSHAGWEGRHPNLGNSVPLLCPERPLAGAPAPWFLSPTPRLDLALP